MEQKIERLTAITTPVGIAVFPWITRPDTRFDPDGVYKTQLAVPIEEGQAFAAQLQAKLDDHFAGLPADLQRRYVKQPIVEEEYSRPVLTKDMSELEREAAIKAHVPVPTGNLLFKFKLNAKVTPRDASKEPFTQKPIVVDAATGAAYEGPLYHGSIIRIKGQIAPYVAAASKSVGLTLRMKAVQVLEAKGGTSTGGNSGFWTDFDNDSE